MAAAAHKQMSADEFLIWPLDQEDRHELVDGYVVKLMSGASGVHDVIVANLIASLHPQLRG